MNKYRDKSDSEINKAVARAIGAKEISDGLFVDETRSYDIYGDKCKHFFDPCNNPADAMPIVIENEISMVHVNNEWSARQFNNHCIEVNDSNYYRAAMICFLMMKDAENEK